MLPSVLVKCEVQNCVSDSWIASKLGALGVSLTTVGDDASVNEVIGVTDGKDALPFLFHGKTLNWQAVMAAEGPLPC